MRSPRADRMEGVRVGPAPAGCSSDGSPSRLDSSMTSVGPCIEDTEPTCWSQRIVGGRADRREGGRPSQGTVVPGSTGSRPGKARTRL